MSRASFISQYVFVVWSLVFGQTASSSFSSKYGDASVQLVFAVVLVWAAAPLAAVEPVVRAEVERSSHGANLALLGGLGQNPQTI